MIKEENTKKGVNMRKKSLNGKRVMALALACSLVMGEAVAAAPADAPAAYAVETEVQIPETEEAEETSVSENDTEVTVSENDTDLDADEAYDGSLSKVIGLSVDESQMDDKIYDFGSNMALRYSKKRADTTIRVQGELKQQSDYGLYAYNGKWYEYAWYSSGYDTTILSTRYEVTLKEGTTDQYYNAQTSLYTIDNVTYPYYRVSQKTINGKTYIVYKKADSVTEVGICDSDEAFNQQYGRYVDTPDYTETADYYEYNGRFFTKNALNYDFVNGKRYYSLYDREEIVFNQRKPVFSWNGLTVPAGAKGPSGQPVYLGYEVEIDGNLCTQAVYEENYRDYSYMQVMDAAGKEHMLSEYTTYTYPKLMANGEKINVRVRGVYYYYDYADNGGKTKRIASLGAWSDVLTYTYTAPSFVPAVASVSAAYTAKDVKLENGSIRNMSNGDGQIRLSWTAVKEVSGYSIYVIRSQKALQVTASNFVKYYDKNYLTQDEKKALGISDTDEIKTDSVTTHSTFYNYAVDKEGGYYYFAVVPYGSVADEKYIDLQTYRSIKAVAAVTVAPQQTMPQITNLHVEKRPSGSQYLVWDPVKEDVVIYAYESADFPNYYTAGILMPERVENGSTYYLDKNESVYGYNGVRELQYNDKAALKKVRTYTIKSYSGYVDSCDISNIVPTDGKTYYFVAYTYDKDDHKERSTPIVYKTTITSVKNGKVVNTPYEKQYNVYSNMSVASAIVSTKTIFGKPGVSTLAKKDNIKLTISKSNVTGFEIYRKKGKKFKKIATITNDVYTDEGLKNNTNYVYKIRAYRYDPDSRKKTYGEYATIAVRTTDAPNLKAKIDKISKTGVKISWTKVANATKYEIYRTCSANADTKTYSKKFSASGSVTSLSNSRQELIKTLPKSKTSYNDKGLVEGENYTYVVMAYYTTGNKTEYVSYSVSADMKLNENVQNLKAEVKGKKALFSWSKDKYASGYEVEYTIYDAMSNPKTEQPVKKKVKGTSFSVPLAYGERVSLRIRGVAKGGVYGSWKSEDCTRYLPAVKGIKASQVTTGNKKGIKISWKKVAGAKYYMVYRSYAEGNYYLDEKVYGLPSSRQLIAKESNDDYKHDDSLTSSSNFNFKTKMQRSTAADVPYEEYYDVSGSVTGTSAVDYADLPAGVTVYYTVVACGDIPCAGTASQITSDRTGKAAKITANGLTKVSVKNSKKGKVTVTFNAVPGAAKYTVYRATKKNGKYTKVTTVKVTKKNKNKKTLSYTGKAAKKKTYYYKVTAEGTNGLKADMDIESSPVKIKVKK